VQGVSEFSGNDFAHLVDFGRIAEIGGEERCREREKQQGDGARAQNFHGWDSQIETAPVKRVRGS
jgi:hypothetical protein